MKIMSIRSLSVALLATLAASAPAGASSITDIYDPTDVYMVASADGGLSCTGTNVAGTTAGDTSNQTAAGCSSLSYTHFLTGYTVPPDSGLTADLTVFYYNDDSGEGSEKFRLVVAADGTVLVDQDEVSNTSTADNPEFYFNPSVATYFADDGALALIVSALGSGGTVANDYFFQKSIVNASWTDGDIDLPDTAAVPEPASLLLVAAGAVAVSQAIRKRKRA
jgi:hypothetical protein